MKHSLLKTMVVVALVSMLGCSGGTKDKKKDESKSDSKKSAKANTSQPESNSEPNSKNEANNFPRPVIGEVAPEITGKDIDGTVFNLSDYRGKAVMIDFWGNW